jgi:hypothetical protein
MTGSAPIGYSGFGNCSPVLPNRLPLPPASSTATNGGPDGGTVFFGSMDRGLARESRPAKSCPWWRGRHRREAGSSLSVRCSDVPPAELRALKTANAAGRRQEDRALRQQLIAGGVTRSQQHRNVDGVRTWKRSSDSAAFRSTSSSRSYSKKIAPLSRSRRRPKRGASSVSLPPSPE